MRYKSLTKFFHLTLGNKTGIPGVVVAIQTFGDYARRHRHIHDKAMSYHRDGGAENTHRDADPCSPP
jgi:hypothetical protein